MISFIVSSSLNNRNPPIDVVENKLTLVFSPKISSYQNSDKSTNVGYYITVILPNTVENKFYTGPMAPLRTRTSSPLSTFNKIIKLFSSVGSIVGYIVSIFIQSQSVQFPVILWLVCHLFDFPFSFPFLSLYFLFHGSGKEKPFYLFDWSYANHVLIYSWFYALENKMLLTNFAGQLSDMINAILFLVIKIGFNNFQKFEFFKSLKLRHTLILFLVT